MSKPCPVLFIPPSRKKKWDPDESFALFLGGLDGFLSVQDDTGRCQIPRLTPFFLRAAWPRSPFFNSARSF